MEKEKNINLDDLFSSFEEKQLLNKRSSFITKDEKANLLRKKENRINKINETLKLNQSRKKIVEASKKMNYKKENIQNWLLYILNIIMGFCAFSMIMFGAFIVAILLTSCFFYSEYQSKIHFYNILLVFSIVIFGWNIRELKAHNWDVDVWSNSILHKTQKNIIAFIEKKIFRNYGEDTFDYAISDYKSTLYYENKTDNELYNSFLLKEIDFLDEKNLSGNIVGARNVSNSIVEISDHQYREYIDEMKELQLMQRFLK